MQAFNLDADRSALLEDQMSKRLEVERARAQAASIQIQQPQIQQPQIQQPKLTKLERRVMEAAWVCGRASIREILEAFPEPRPAYTTIQTIVYRLEEKKAVRRVRKVSNAHIFEPVLPPPPAAVNDPASPLASQNGTPPNETRLRLLDEILSFFGGPRTMLTQLIECGKLTLEDIRGLERSFEQRAGS
jgi:BlaI family transcriptional regulator, penicillinase repressor